MTGMHRLLVSGRVQQVGYRDYIVRTAKGLGLTGWVRNLSDGRVEILAAGDQEALGQLVERSRSGPPLAHIADIDVYPVEEKPVKGFTKRFTA
jgi:acylphosphatase